MGKSTSSYALIVVISDGKYPIFTNIPTFWPSYDTLSRRSAENWIWVVPEVDVDSSGLHGNRIRGTIIQSYYSEEANLCISNCYHIGQ